MSEPQERKGLLRAEMRARRRSLDTGEQALAAAGLMRSLLELPGLGFAQRLMGSLPAGGEIDARPFCAWWLEALRRPLFLPLVEKSSGTLSIRAVPNFDRVLPGYRGILEPLATHCREEPAAMLDVVLVPGLAFDGAGNRLGQGGGHYDRVLPECDDALIVGLAHDFQILGRLEAVEPHDRRVDWIATPTRLIACR